MAVMVQHLETRLCWMQDNLHGFPVCVLTQRCQLILEKSSLCLFKFNTNTHFEQLQETYGKTFHCYDGRHFKCQTTAQKHIVGMVKINIFDSPMIKCNKTQILNCGFEALYSKCRARRL